MTNEELTIEDIDRHYSAALDSVNLLNNGKHTDMSDEEWADTVDRNVRHLQIMVSKDFWTDDHDLTPLHDAIDQHSKEQ